MTTKETKEKIQKILDKNKKNYEYHTPILMKISILFYCVLLGLWVFLLIFLVCTM